MKLSTKGRHAVSAMMELAVREAEGPVALSVIADGLGISLSYLEQLFARLRRAGLVSGVRGPGGGYRLAQPMQAISVADVITAVDESVGTGEERAAERCLTHDLWADLSTRIHGFLDGITLADLAARPTVHAAIPDY